MPMTVLKGLISLVNHFVDLFWGIGYFGWQFSMLYAAYISYSFSGIYLAIYLFVFVLSGLINHLVLKRYIYGPRPLGSKPFLANEHFKKHVNGMPSGHAQQAAFSLTYAYLLSGKYAYETIALFLLTLFQRYVYKNHTLMQLVAGSLIGIGVAYLTILLIKN